MNRLLAGIEERRAAVVTGRPSRIHARLPLLLQAPVAERVRAAVAENVAQRVWRRDASLWGGPGVPEIEDRLGWLTVSEPMLEHAADLHAFAARVPRRRLHRRRAARDGRLVARARGDPAVVRRRPGRAAAARARLDPPGRDARRAGVDRPRQDAVHRLVEVGRRRSRRCRTIEYFKALAGPRAVRRDHRPRQPARAAGVATTGSARCFLNPPDIGGRYSVLSLLRAGPGGADGREHRGAARTAARSPSRCARTTTRASPTPACGSAPSIGELARQGRDKLTFVISPPIESFGLWVEQLVAESTGKHGRGILPVADEPLGDTADVYGDDRVFVYLRNARAPRGATRRRDRALSAAGHPTITLPAHGPADLGRIFFLTEFAVAVAGWALEINPFDQPNVQEAKDNTTRVLDVRLGPVDRRRRRRRAARAAGRRQAAALRRDHGLPRRRRTSSTRRSRSCGRRSGPPPAPRPRSATARASCTRPASCTRAARRPGASCSWSTRRERDADIPGAGYSFGTLIAAQAAGDLETLRAHGLAAERVELEGDPAAAVRALTERIKAILERS